MTCSRHVLLDLMNPHTALKHAMKLSICKHSRQSGSDHAPHCEFRYQTSLSVLASCFHWSYITNLWCEYLIVFGGVTNCGVQRYITRGFSISARLTAIFRQVMALHFGQLISSTKRDNSTYDSVTVERWLMVRFCLIWILWWGAVLTLAYVKVVDENNADNEEHREWLHSLAVSTISTLWNPCCATTNACQQ